ncbi:MAG: ABC transporter permease [Chitinophagales bacterium]|nr:ABC transporter permease [Chitinophagales bacterium]
MQTEITARKKWQFLDGRDLREVIHYKDLLYMLVVRDINVLYKQTILGFAWAIVKPLFQALIFTVIFGYLAGMANKMQGNIPYIVFTFAGLVPWTYFATAITGSTGSLIANTQFLTKVYFPRIIIPLTPILSKMVDFVVSLVALIILILAYGIAIPPTIIYLPIVLILLVLTTFGMGLWLSAMAIQYRDVQQLMQFLVPILMYMAPVVLPLAVFLKMKPWVVTVLSFYPMTGIVEGFRVCMVGGDMPWHILLYGSITTFIILFTGIIFFRAKEDFFADVV